MIVLTALLLTDRRLYEAAESMGTTRRRQFFTITLPAARYGLVSAAMVVFSYTVSDFGIPKVIGGNYHVLAIDIYQQVIGQQNFNRGAVVGLMLLMPVVLAFGVDWWMQGRAQSQFSARAVPYVAAPRARIRCRDVRLLRARVPVHARGARHGGLHVVHQAVAVRPALQPAPLRLRAGRRRGDRGLLQQPSDGVRRGAVRHPDHLRHGLPAREDEGRASAARRHPPARHDPDGGARHGAGPGLHLLLQRAGQSSAWSCTAA